MEDGKKLDDESYPKYEAFEFEGSFVADGNKPYNIRHRAYHFAKDVVNWFKTVRYDRKFSSLFTQLIRSNTSICANLVEGRAGSSTKDWVKFMTIALKSANETKYWLCLIRDTQPSLDLRQLTILIKEADEISKIIASLILSFRAQSPPGSDQF